MPLAIFIPVTKRHTNEGKWGHWNKRSSPLNYMDLHAQPLLNQNPQLLKTGQLVAISQFGQGGKYRVFFFNHCAKQ